MPFDPNTAVLDEETPAGKFDPSTAVLDEPAPANAAGRLKQKFWGKLGAEITPAMTAEHPVFSAIAKTGQDVATIPADFFNQLLMNYPRSALNKANIDFPATDNPVAGVAAKAAGVAGALGNPLGKALGAAKDAPLLAKSVISALGAGAYAPTEDIVGLKQRAGQAALGAVIPVVGAGISKIPGKVGGLGNKIFRSGLSKEEALRVESQYGNSNAALVDAVKSKLNDKISSADKVYQSVMSRAPEGKQINVRPAIEEAGKRLKSLGLITRDGNLTELGTSEIARDSVYGKLLDFYKSADSISGVGSLAEKPSLTGGQMVKWMKAQRETMVNKDQYTFLRDKLNALYKNKPSDVDVSKVVNQFYADGESSGLKGLQQARQLTREAFRNEDRFLNRNTGDLKVANEANLSKVGVKTSRGQPALSKQTLDHIAELEKYVGHPIIKDATSINKLNQAYERMKAIKKYGGVAIGGAVAGDFGRKIIHGSF